MKYKIGVDFDNTIACYDSVFAYGARLLGINIPETVFNKSDVKNHILSGRDGDIIWQKIQGQIYGRLMNRAVIFNGFTEFLKLARLEGHEIFIISHKTPFGHFDEEQFSLPAEAMKWLIKNGIAGDDTIPQKNIFFEPTRELKLKRIGQLGCTHFIDDLTEVLDEPDFPNLAIKYLFNAHPNNEYKNLNYFQGSWRSITRQILGEWTEQHVLHIVQHAFAELNIGNVVLTKGRGNSRIYKLTSVNNKQYALKIYPDLQIDNRPRLQTEFTACKILSDAALPVVNAVAKDPALNWAIFAWIDGIPANANEEFLYQSLEFVAALIRLSHTSASALSLPNASEACLSGTDIIEQIERRLNRLMLTGNTGLTEFLENQFLPIYHKSVNRGKELLGEKFYTSLPHDLMIISPSDFGAHNAITNQKGNTYFIDFEYFGWDDPVKLACDYYWHPGMSLSDTLKQLWIKRINTIFASDPYFAERLAAYLPLFGLRWCLILLNEFLKDKIIQRIRADQDKGANINNVQEIQFLKAKNILKDIKTILNYG